MKNYPKFKCRCSSIGKIMTDPKEKSGTDRYNDALSTYNEVKEKYANTANKETKTAQALLERVKKYELLVNELEAVRGVVNLSKTCKDAVDEWCKLKLDYPVKQFSNKYTKKGLSVEDDAIEYISNYYGWVGAKKNTERKTNEYISGECDVLLQDGIVDVKSSWSDKTFPLFGDKIDNVIYIYQGMGYMALWGKNTFQLSYVLMNAPDFLIDQEANRLRFELGLDEVDAEMWEEVKQKHTYDHLPDFLRIKSFVFERDDSVIESIYERVELCRTYLEQTGFYDLYEKYLTFKNR